MITIHLDQIAAILALNYDAVTVEPVRLNRIKRFRAMTGYGLWEAKILCEAEEERRGVRACPIAKALEVIRDRRHENACFRANND